MTIRKRSNLLDVFLCLTILVAVTGISINSRAAINHTTNDPSKVSSDHNELEILNPLKIPQFQYDLPIPERVHLDRKGDPDSIEMKAQETEQFMGIVDDQGQPLMTKTKSF